ncbi:hypothetical protein RFI_14561, partial [Reticulomyxa filosa]
FFSYKLKKIFNDQYSPKQKEKRISLKKEKNSKKSILATNKKVVTSQNVMFFLKNKARLNGERKVTDENTKMQVEVICVVKAISKKILKKLDVQCN